MFTRIRFYCALLLVSILIIFNSESRADENTPGPLNDFGIRLDYGITGSYWFTSDDDDSEEGVGHALDYEPEFIPVQAFQGELMWRNSSWFRINYESAFTKDGAQQKAILEISDKKSSLEKLNAFIDVFYLFAQSDNSTLQFLSRLRLDYKRHLFFGKAGVQETTNYITADNTTTTLQPGDEIRFKSDFEEFSINLFVTRYFWMGLYQNTTVKPHESSTQITQVLETEITGRGLRLHIESDSFIFGLNLGSVKFRADQDNFRSDGFETMIHCEWRPNIYLIGSSTGENSRHRLILLPLISMQFSMQIGSEAENQESDGTGELSMDIIVDGGLRLRYYF